MNLRSLASVKITNPKPVAEGVPTPAASLTEGEALIEAPSIPGDSKLLQECYASDAYGTYTERTLEEKLRDAVSQIRYALESEAYKGMGDDGKVRKPYKDGEDNPWHTTEKLLAKNINVKMFTDMLPEVKVAISKFYE
jgi:hypothetical protein